MNSQHTHTQFQKIILSLQPVLYVGLKIYEIQKQIILRFGMTNSINMHLRLKIPPTQHEF